MIKGINHVGIVVKNADEAANFLARAVGAKILERVNLEEAGQISCLVQFGDAKYELMEPLGEGSVVGRFLEGHGEGFHHISLLSDSFDADCVRMEQEGVKIVGRSDLNGVRYAFTHPKTSGGILYEIAGE